MGNQIPSSGDVASYKDRKGEDGKRVHRTVYGVIVMLMVVVVMVVVATGVVVVASLSPAVYSSRFRRRSRRRSRRRFSYPCCAVDTEWWSIVNSIRKEK